MQFLFFFNKFFTYFFRNPNSTLYISSRSSSLLWTFLSRAEKVCINNTLELTSNSWAEYAIYCPLQSFDLSSSFAHSKGNCALRRARASCIVRIAVVQAGPFGWTVGPAPRLRGHVTCDPNHDGQAITLIQVCLSLSLPPSLSIFRPFIGRGIGGYTLDPSLTPLW